MTNSFQPSMVAQKIQNWLSTYLKQSQSTGFVIGISGGLDSSVTAVLCRKVTPNTLGLILPCGFTPKDSIKDAQLIAKQFDIKTKIYDLTPAFNAFCTLLGVSQQEPVDIPLANIKARLRMVAWYFEANRLRRLVAGSGNRTEIAVGFFTKYGDAGVDILPIGGLLKHEVRNLGHYLKIPLQIINKIPSPGLWPGQTDEGELGASYDQLDDLVAGKTPKGLSEEQIAQIHQRITSTEHKRKILPICPI